MSNGIASGVPPAGYDCGGGAAGVGVCAGAGEAMTAMAHAARVIETIERIKFSLLKFVFVLRALDTGLKITSESKRRPRPVPSVGDARGLQGPVRLLLRGSDEYLGARLDLVPAADGIGTHQ